MRNDKQLRKYLRRHTMVVWAFFVIVLMLLFTGHNAFNVVGSPWLLFIISVLLFLCKYAGYEPYTDIDAFDVEHED